MRVLTKRIISIALALCLCLAMLPTVAMKAEAVTPTYAVSSSYHASSYYTALCNVTLTGNQREDIVNVALSQVGYRESSYSGDYDGTDDGSYNNYTEYNYWYNKYINRYMNVGGSEASWCATFVSWCARQAGIPDSILRNSINAAPNESVYSSIVRDHFGISYYDGKTYRPERGDLFFTRSWSHVGLVVDVDGEYVITVEGNTNTNRSPQGNGVYRLTTRRISDLYFGVPNYEATTAPEKPTITTTTAYYTEGSDIAISWNAVVGNTEYWINLYKDGELIVNQSMGNQTTYTYENAGVGEYTFAVSANNSVGTSGGTQYAFLVGMAPKKTTASIDKTSYAEGDTITIKWTPEIGTTYYWINVRKDGKLIVDEATGTSTSYTMENAEIGEYTVAVSANNGAGNSGKSSIAFTVSALSAPEVTSAKTYYKPGQTVEVTWNKIDNAAQYIYYLAEYPEEFAYTTNVSNARVTENKVAFTDLPNGRYRMFVRSISAAEKWSGNSNWLTFYVYNYDYIPVRVVENDGHIYALYDDEMSWDFAKIICDEMGGYLATITSEEENKLITELIGYGENDAYWLGASNVDSSDYKITGQPFQWITGEEFEYTNWKAGEPSQSGEKADLEHFLEIRKSYDNKWNDTANTNRKDKGFILEVDTTAYKPATTSVHGNSKYLLFDESIPWSIAKVYCETIGGHLATVSSAEEDHAIHTLIQQGQKPWYFIGASKQNSEWAWLDGSKVPLSGSYANWGDTSGQEQTGPTGWGNYLMKYKTSSLWIGISNFYSPESNMRRVGFVCELDDVADTELEHSFTNYISNGDATCTVDGTKTAKCDYCDATDTITDVGSALGHDYKSTVNAPTCVEKGYTTHTCHCGDSYVDSYVDATGHKFGDWTVTTEPTCTESGEERRDCDNCDHFETREVEATGHDYEAVVTAPTCVKKGYTTHTCHCGDSYVDSYVDAAGHKFGEWTVITEPTCTKNGEERRDCANCDHFETREVEAIGHDYDAVITNPTCTDKGFTTHTCHCGDSYTDSYVDASGHKFGNWAVVDEPTCTKKGEERRDCANCDHLETREIEAIGHDYEAVVTAPTCVEKGYTTHTCHCGNSYVDSYVEATGHKYENGSCTVCGEPEVKYLPGDVDLDGDVDVDDVLALLWYVLFPEDYPIEVDVDFDRNGSTDVDDVLTLLWYVLFPEDYPLN